MTKGGEANLWLLKSKLFWLGIVGAVTILLRADVIDQMTLAQAIGAVLAGIFGKVGERAWKNRAKKQSP